MKKLTIEIDEDMLKSLTRLAGYTGISLEQCVTMLLLETEPLVIKVLKRYEKKNKLKKT